MRTRGKRYDQVKSDKIQIGITLQQQRDQEERKKQLRRSNERLKMLDDMGRQRQIKLQEDLLRLESEKEAERSRQHKLAVKNKFIITPKRPGAVASGSQVTVLKHLDWLRNIKKPKAEFRY